MKCPYFQSECLKTDCTAFEKEHIEIKESVQPPSPSEWMGGIIVLKKDTTITENYCRLLKCELPVRKNNENIS